MRAELMGFYDESNTDPRGTRVAAYVRSYLNAHKGLSLGELAFRLKADKRDLYRLVNDESCGWRLEDKLAAYFGPTFVDEVFAPLFPSGRSIRELELETERAEIAARYERLERDRRARAHAPSSPGAALRLVDDEAGATGV